MELEDFLCRCGEADFRREPDKAFEWLERAYVQRDPGLIMSAHDLFLQPLHGDARKNFAVPDGYALFKALWPGKWPDGSVMELPEARLSMPGP